MATESKAPSLMHFPLARLYCEEGGYAIRRATWDGSQGGHELAWLIFSNGIYYYVTAAGSRIVRGTHISGVTTIRGDVMGEDLLATDWTTLKVGCTQGSDCVCGDQIILQGVAGFPTSVTQSGTPAVNITDPNAAKGLAACELPPADWLAGIPSESECDCYTPVSFGETTPTTPLPDPTNGNGGASPVTVAAIAAAAVATQGSGSGGTAGGSGSAGGGSSSNNGGAAGSSGASSGQGGGPGGSGGGGGGSSGGGGGGGPPANQPCDPQNCAAGRHWDSQQCKCVDDGGGGGGPSVTITATRNKDTLVACVSPNPNTDPICPDDAPREYMWMGTVSLSAPNNTNAWSTTIRRNDIHGGEVLWTGNLEDGGSHDFTSDMPNSPIRPGQGFTFSVTCNELLGDGSCSDSQAASIPGCEECGNLQCPVQDPNNPAGPPIELVCENGQVLDPVNCVCYDPPVCPNGQHWVDTLMQCCDDAGTEPGEPDGFCGFIPFPCPAGQHWVDTLMQCCDDAGTNPGDPDGFCGTLP